MKIAVACMGTQVSPHFGHCEQLLIYHTDQREIVSETSIPNPPHKPGFLPNFLADQGVETVIVGGIGGGAIEIFNERGITVITGAQGGARTAVEAFITGTLQSTGTQCYEHAHSANCGEHNG